LGRLPAAVNRFLLHDCDDRWAIVGHSSGARKTSRSPSTFSTEVRGLLLLTPARQHGTPPSPTTAPTRPASSKPCVRSSPVRPTTPNTVTSQPDSRKSAGEYRHFVDATTALRTNFLPNGRPSGTVEDALLLRRRTPPLHRSRSNTHELRGMPSWAARVEVQVDGHLQPAGPPAPDDDAQVGEVDGGMNGEPERRRPSSLAEDAVAAEPQ
jgi:hypothetical protein